MPSIGLRRRADLSGALDRAVVLEPAFLVVAADAARSVKDGVRAVRVDMHLDPRLDEMRAHRAFRDLELQRAVGDAIVVSDLPLLLDAQDLVEIDAWNGREGGALAGRLNREARVVGGQIDLAEEGVGRFDVGYAAWLSSADSPAAEEGSKTSPCAQPLGLPSGASNPLPKGPDPTRALVE